MPPAISNKTTVLFEKSLLEEIDRLNPFHTRKDFLGEACKSYLNKLKRKNTDEQLARACSDAEEDDSAVIEELNEKVWIVTGLY